MEEDSCGYTDVNTQQLIGSFWVKSFFFDIFLSLRCIKYRHFSWTCRWKMHSLQTFLHHYARFGSLVDKSSNESIRALLYGPLYLRHFVLCSVSGSSCGGGIHTTFVRFSVRTCPLPDVHLNPSSSAPSPLLPS